MPDAFTAPTGPVVPVFFGTLSGHLRYRVGGEERLVVLPFAPRAELADLFLETALLVEERQLRLAVTLHPAVPLELLEAKLELRLSPELHREVVSGLANGWQSWSLTRELDRTGTLDPPSPLLWFLRPLGDSGFTPHGSGPGVFHSWSFTHLRLREGFVLAGSTAEDSGFTLLRLDLQTGTIEAEKDCAGRRLAGAPYRLFGLHVERCAGLGEAMDRYLKAAGIAPRPVPARKAFGWTSWYRHYTKIAERAILEDLDALAGLGVAADYFQIDDGYAPAVGDWLQPSPKFPRGMQAIAEQVRARGFSPGIWLAPFVVEKRSRVFRDHPDWLLRDEHGLPVDAGWNPSWSGTFYALDSSRAPVREHVRAAVSTMVGEWGFELVKADFLYAAALRPTPGRTRGERMAEALELLREAVGEKTLLACGVPLASAAGRVEHSRIGPDVSPYWEDRLLARLRHGERVSTRASLVNTLERAHLNRRFFGNDPDVFILRRTRSRLTVREARTLFVVNYLLSGILLFSDDPAGYGPEKRLLLRGFPMLTPERAEVSRQGGLYHVALGCRGQRYLLLANLGDADELISLSPGQLQGEIAFDQLEGELLPAPDGLSAVVPAHGCRLFKISPAVEAPVVLGTTLHLLGGAGDVELTEGEAGLSIRLRGGVEARGRVVVGLPAGSAGEVVRVDGRPLTVREKRGVRYVELDLPA